MHCVPKHVMWAHYGSHFVSCRSSTLPSFVHVLHTVDGLIHFYHTLPQQLFPKLKNPPHMETI